MWLMVKPKIIPFLGEGHVKQDCHCDHLTVVTKSLVELKEDVNSIVKKLDDRMKKLERYTRRSKFP